MKTYLSLILLLNFVLVMGQNKDNQEVLSQTVIGLRSESSFPKKYGDLHQINTIEFDQYEKQTNEVEIMPCIQNKFYNRTTLGALSGSQASFTFNVVNGYSFNKRWNAGLGLGMEYYLGNMHLSYFADVQYNFGKYRTRPFLAFNIGISEPLRQNNFDKGGAFTGLQFGIMHFTNNYFALTTSIGYRLSILDFRNSWFEDYITRGHFNQIELRFGFSLK